MVTVTLNSSMRSNLLSLQNTSRLQDVVSNRLATGLKVNSAIDNPSSYYTAQSLSNRAADLNALLDNMSQGIQNLKAASEALEAGAKFLQQAKAAASTAKESSQPIIAEVSTEAELLAALNSDKKGLIVVASDITLTTNISLKDGQSLVGISFLDKTKAKTSLSFNFNNNPSHGIEVTGNSLISDLNLNLVTNKKNPGNTESFTSGFIKITNADAVTKLNNLHISMDTSADTSESIYAAVMGVNNKTKVEISGNVTYEDAGIRGNNMRTYGFNKTNLVINDNATLNINTQGAKALSISNSKLTVSEKATLNISTQGERSHVFYSVDAEIKGKLNAKVSGNLAYIIYSSDVKLRSTADVKLNATQNTNALLSISTLSWDANSHLSYANSSYIPPVLGNYVSTTAGTTPPSTTQKDPELLGWTKESEFTGLDDSLFNNALTAPDADNANEINAGSFNAYNSYVSIIENYDSLIKDASYKGVNLLLNDNIKVNFNEDRSSNIEIKGVNVSAQALNLNSLSWTTTADVDESIQALENAINKLRAHSAEFGNYYNIVSTREEFTENLINVLTEGADKLTLADMNQESANMLALQTRQQLAINSLSLASQAAQSVLKLF